MATKISLSEILATFVANEQSHREQAVALRLACAGAIDPDCLAWLTAEIAAETWRVAVLALAPYIRDARPRRRRRKGGDRGA